MTQQLDNTVNPEDVQIQRMLAYKSLILSILQRNIIFLVIVAFIVYFAFPHNRMPFLSISAVSIAIKTADYIIRFFVK